MIINPTTGKITYWESITCASTLDIMRQQRRGVESIISAKYSGETVTHIVNAESAGFVLGFSTGRVAYLGVRDGQGRPGISVQFLRSGNMSMGSGLFGSLRKVLTSAPWNSDIAAIRAGPQTKVGERDIVVATAGAKLQAWTIHRGGHCTLRSDLAARDKIFAAIRELDSRFEDTRQDSLQMLDMVYMPRPAQNGHASDEQDHSDNLLVLTAVNNTRDTAYFLVEVAVLENDITIGYVRPMRSYTTPITQTAMVKPRLYLPNPAMIAYIVFDRAVVVMSTAKPANSAASQLQMEGRLQPAFFEDVLDFRHDPHVEIVGSGMEEPHGLDHDTDDQRNHRHKARHPAAILLVRGGGVLRVAALDTVKLVASQGHRITAKGKLEQAVFFSRIEKTPLSFVARSELKFSADEVGQAALELSDEILASQNPNITSTASLDQNLRHRSALLRILAEHLQTTGVQLDRITRWKLLWAAERMVAANIIWDQYNTRLRNQSSRVEKDIVPEVISFIHENLKSEPNPSIGEQDPVRHWFLKDIGNVGVALPWAYQVLKYAVTDSTKEVEHYERMLCQANQLVTGVLNAVYQFRSDSLATYDLDNEPLEHGILASNYEGLPAIWTSPYVVVENLRKQYDLSGSAMVGYQAKLQQSEKPLLDMIRAQYPDLLDISMKATEEHVRWASAHDDPQTQLLAEQILQKQDEAQRKFLPILADDMGLPDEAMDLAEKYGFLQTVAVLLVMEFNKVHAAFARPDARLQSLALERAKELNARFAKLFDDYGAAWASALFEKYIESDCMERLLNEHRDQAEHLTTFLHSKPEYAKIAWIQDILEHRDYEKASETLIEQGLHREQDLWSQKIELSLGKLSLLATQEQAGRTGATVEDAATRLKSTHDKLALVDIQEQVFNYIYPHLVSALDESAELQICKENFRNPLYANMPALQLILSQSLEVLLKHESMDPLLLIDLLTLLYTNHASDPDESFPRQQFYLALRASQHMQADMADMQLTQRIIWRRCMLRDDWKLVNDTTSQDDESVEARLRQTVLYQTFKSCVQQSK